MFSLRFVLICLLNVAASKKEFSLARYSDTAVYANNSVIDIHLVGEGFEGAQITDGGALECHTDDTTCCRGTDNPNGTGRGEWYYPNGTVVPPPSVNGTGFYRTRDHMVIRLNRLPRSLFRSLFGVYRCEIPGSGGVNISRYIKLSSEEGTCMDLQAYSHMTIVYTPPRAVSASLPASKRYTGAIATYSCSPEYQLVGGSSVRACGPDGMWNGTELFCVSTSTLDMTLPTSSSEGLIDPKTENDYTNTITPGYSISTTQTTSSSDKHTTETIATTEPVSDNSTVAVVAAVLIVVIVVSLTILIAAITLIKKRRSNLKRFEKAEEERTLKKNGQDWSSMQSVNSRIKTDSLTGRHEEAEIKSLTETVTVDVREGVESKDYGDSNDDTLENIDTNEPILVVNFGEFVTQQHAWQNKGFSRKFEGLPKGEEGHPVTVSRNNENAKSNRFKNITVYDDHRIVLQTRPDEHCQNSYINASHVDGFSISNKFIATQGPLPKTVVDFWRMVWQERPSAIVMLTNCKEGGKVKCEQYWPESGNEVYGPFQIFITDKQILADYTVRSFLVRSESSKRNNGLQLTQFHFTAWPDHGVPEYATPILAFIRRIRAFRSPNSGALIVHCSAGVGRTGTYITLDNVLDQIDAEGVVDVDGVIVKARNQRMKMVQTKEQYIFINDAILEFLTCGDTQISANEFQAEVQKLGEEGSIHKCTGYQHQFNILDQVSPSPTEVNCSTALKHPDKNRGNQYLPAETSRVILWGEQPDYIHAVTANGYKHKRAYIIAQNPLSSTVRNFWKVTMNRQCSAIVMLSNMVENKKEACAVYWPEEEGVAYGEFKVDIIGKEECPGFTIRKMVVSDSNVQESHQVTQFHVTNWSPDGTCSNLKVLTDVVEEVAKVQRRTGNNSIVVHCSDTVSRSGMFCAIATTIDRCKTEGVVDVFQMVKALRIHKPGAVLNVAQYKLIHEAVLVYLEAFDTYANFQTM